MLELSEAENQSVIDLAEYRSKAKTILDEFYSVQFFLLKFPITVSRRDAQ
jgi:hypothetical protein